MNMLPIVRAMIVALILGLCVPAIAEVHGVLRVVKGDVQIKSGGTGQTGRARLGQQVYPKDTIITGKDARAKIVMIDNNELNISPDSQIEIKNYEYNPTENKKDVLLNVLYGKVRSKVEQKYDGKTSKFQVKTPSAVAGVRGTDFVTSYNSATQHSQVVTFRGAVEFGLPGPHGAILNGVSVTPGKMAEISKAGAAPSAPTNLPKEQFSKVDHETKVDTGNGASSGTPSSDSHAAPSGQDKGDKSKSGSDNGSASNGTSSSSSQSGAASSNNNGPNSSNAPSSTSGVASNTSSADNSRGPASSGGGGPIMLNPSVDLPSGADAPKAPALPVAPCACAVQITQPKVNTPPPPSTFQSNLIQNTNSKLTVHVNQ